MNVTNFTTSWVDGRAMCALLNILLGDEKMDMSQVSQDDAEHNRKIAVKVAT